MKTANKTTMKTTLEETLARASRIVIDGSMSTALEELGANLNSRLWTAKVLVEQPELVERVHYDYFVAGADCGITCSYQATIPGLTENGCTAAEAEEIIRRSVALFLSARDKWWAREGESSGRACPLCLGSCGPYGAYLADASEYRGNYGLSRAELREFHQRRAELLLEAGADLLLFETQPSLDETIAEAEVAESLGADFWVSYSCQDGKRTCEGQNIADCARELSKYPHLKMIGVNCTAPEHILSLIRELKSATNLPIAVYPNSGKVYDPTTKAWSDGGDPKDFGDYALQWFRAGAAAVGGCCTTTGEHVRACAQTREKYLAEQKY